MRDLVHDSSTTKDPMCELQEECVSVRLLTGTLIKGSVSMRNDTGTGDGPSRFPVPLPVSHDILDDPETWDLT